MSEKKDFMNNDYEEFHPASDRGINNIFKRVRVYAIYDSQQFTGLLVAVREGTVVLEKGCEDDLLGGMKVGDRMVLERSSIAYVVEKI